MKLKELLQKIADGSFNQAEVIKAARQQLETMDSQSKSVRVAGYDNADASYKTEERFFINVADLEDPEDPRGRSYREVNRGKKHKFNVGQLVELESGVRMFVVKQTRDCDLTPLYSLSPDKEDAEQERENSANYSWHSGYSEEGMKAVL